MAGYLGLTIVEVECVIVVVIGLDAVQIQEDIVELLEEEEACCHALPSGDRVTLTRAPCKVHIIPIFCIKYIGHLLRV
jgi:hypothetical protein